MNCFHSPLLCCCCFFVLAVVVLPPPHSYFSFHSPLSNQFPTTLFTFRIFNEASLYPPTPQIETSSHKQARASVAIVNVLPHETQIPMWLEKDPKKRSVCVYVERIGEKEREREDEDARAAVGMPYVTQLCVPSLNISKQTCGRINDICSFKVFFPLFTVCLFFHQS